MSASAIGSSHQAVMGAVFEADKTRDIMKVTSAIQNCMKKHGLGFQEI